MSAIRPPAIAGTFYTSDTADLSDQLDGFLAKAKTVGIKPPKAIIAPHAGFIYSGPCAAQAYASLQANAEKIKRVVLLGPCHRVAVQGIATSNADFWQTPLGKVEIDTDTVNQLTQLSFVNENEAAHADEHSLEIHLPFLQKTLGDFKLIPLAVGNCHSEDIANLLSKLWGGVETLIVVSTDLSHFHDYATAQKLDGGTAQAIEAFNWQAIGRDHACGRVPMSGLLNYAQKHNMSIKRVGLCNSGDAAGDKARVVGYGAWVLHEKTDDVSDDDWLMQQHESQLKNAVTRSIHYGLKHSKQINVDVNSFSSGLQNIRATFVTLTKNGQLRGCIGTVLPHRPLIADLVHNAYSAAFSDPRFKPVSIAELPEMNFAIPLLSPMTEMQFESESDLLSQLRPNIDGLLIKDLGKQSVFLPQVWEQLPDPKTFLSHLRQKAGLSANHWSDSFQAWNYQVAKTTPQKFQSSQ